MKLSRLELVELNLFLRVIASQYKHFGKEVNTLARLIDEVEAEDELDNYYFQQLQKSQKEIKMLRDDLAELSKEHFKK
jgi:hypothetical protein